MSEALVYLKCQRSTLGYMLVEAMRNGDSVGRLSIEARLDEVEKEIDVLEAANVDT